MSVKLLTEHHLEFLNLKGGCTGLSESTVVKMPHCCESRVMAHNVGQGHKSWSAAVHLLLFRLITTDGPIE